MQCEIHAGRSRTLRVSPVFPCKSPFCHCSILSRCIPATGSTLSHLRFQVTVFAWLATERTLESHYVHSGAVQKALLPGHIAASLEKWFPSFRRNVLPSSSSGQGSRDLAFISKLILNICKAQGTVEGKWPASYLGRFTSEEFPASTE